MRDLLDIVKDIRKWWDEKDHDLLDPNEFEDLCNELELAAMNEAAAKEFEKQQNEYIDPSELGGCSGHYADENMYMRGDSHGEE